MGVVNRGERPRFPLRKPAVREGIWGEFLPGEVFNNIRDRNERSIAPSRVTRDLNSDLSAAAPLVPSEYAGRP